MSDQRRPVRFETEQLPEFLDHIARKEAEELDRLRQEYGAATRQVRTEARRQSRRYHRRISEQTRARLESEHARRVSGTRNELRRRRWDTLRELRARASDKLWELLMARWGDPDAQLAWCRYWLQQCERLDSDAAIEIRVSSDVHESTLEALRQWAGRCDPPAEVAVAEDMGEGIRIHVGARSIDGLLRTQLDHLLESIHHELAGWLHDDGVAPGEDDE